VNNRGQRFLDEAPGAVDAHYDAISKAIAYQPGGIAHVIFDSRVQAIPRWQAAIRSDVPPLQADSLAGLAKLMGVPEEPLLATVQAYNEACKTGGTYDPLQLDYRSTTGLTPPKSHWSWAISEPPFRAYPIVSANCFTYGGLKVNRDAEVLDNDGKVIRGLYAAGETVGIYHQVYPGSTSVLRAAVFGRLAGQRIGQLH
jgi:tricarballylate dehydrogenase